MEAGEFISQFEDECRELAQPIIQKICKRILTSWNKQLTNTEGDSYDEIGMTYVDKLSIKYQSRSLEEFGYGFEDAIDDAIDAEYNCLNLCEQLILDYSECGGYYSLKYDCDREKVKKNILDELCKMIDKHYYTSRVQRFIERYDWLSN
jgi:hypothetical protein